MTLRGSDQSLLHTLILRQGREGKQHPRALLNITLAGLTAATVLLLGGMFLFGTLERGFVELNTSSDPNIYADLAESWKASDPVKAQARDPYGQIGDVIIETEQPYRANILKHLTRERGGGFLSAHEVSRDVVLTALARTEMDNFAISSDLKFYRTQDGNVILACANEAPPFDPLGNIEQSCFTIDTTPVGPAIIKPPSFL